MSLSSGARLGPYEGLGLHPDSHASTHARIRRTCDPSQYTRRHSGHSRNCA
jgi:hypothetical protein